MNKGKWIIAILALVQVCAANDLLQQYEKAYYQETAKGQVREAAGVYQTIAEAEATDANKEAIQKSLMRLLEIGTQRKHEATIRDCHEKLLTKTDTTIQLLAEITEEGGTVFIPPGIHKGTVVLDKPLTLKGSDRDTCILAAEADQPLIHVTKSQDVLIESLTLRSQLATSERTDPPGCALLVQDAKATLKGCAVIAMGNSKRCPLGVYVQGFSEVQLLDSFFEGYAYPIFYADGTEGLVNGCIVKNPIDCGFMSHADSEVTIAGSIFTGSAKHGVRSTGGTIHLNGNLIIKNKNRGIYLGNKTTHGEIVNNAIVENGSGISTFASSDIEIVNNVILGNGFSGIDTRYYGQIQVKNNIIANNEKMGFAVFEEGSPKFRVGKNTFHGNGVPAEDFDLPSSTLEEDPEFADASNGDFTVGNSTVNSAEHGLADPAVIGALWKKYRTVGTTRTVPLATNKAQVSRTVTKRKSIKASALAWQQTDPYTPPDFDGFFPDDQAGGNALDELWKAKDKDTRTDDEILETVRNGLQQTTTGSQSLLRWIGNKYIWGKNPQHPYAVEIMYHASATPGHRYNSIYFGLSVVHAKTPALLHALADQSMLKESPADFGRVSWGAKADLKKLARYIEPYLEAEDPELRERAIAYRKVCLGELDLGTWQAEQALKKAKAKYAGQLPEIKKTLLSGTSAERKEVLKLRDARLIMDDSFVAAFGACLEDLDAQVRDNAVKAIGGRWIWSTIDDNPEAIELMLKATTDPYRPVRYSSVYYGLSTVNDKSDVVIDRMIEMAIADQEHNFYGRVVWGLRRDKEKAEKALTKIIENDDTATRTAALKLYKDIIGEDYKGGSE
jgi:nitrous oxidase accessory protein NosD